VCPSFGLTSGCTTQSSAADVAARMVVKWTHYIKYSIFNKIMSQDFGKNIFTEIVMVSVKIFLPK